MILTETVLINAGLLKGLHCSSQWIVIGSLKYRETNNVFFLKAEKQKIKIIRELLKNMYIYSLNSIRDTFQRIQYKMKPNVCNDFLMALCLCNLGQKCH